MAAVRFALRMAPVLPEARRRGAIAWLCVAGCVVAAVGVGAAAALGGRWLLLVGGSAALTLFLAPTAFAERKPLSGYLAIEGPVVLLLMSTLVFRQRDAAALASNPLDSAGIYRVVCVGLAALLGWAAVLRGSRAEHERLKLPLTVRLYVAYIIVVFLGAIMSVDPSLTAYRGVELVAGILVILGAAHVGGRDAIDRLERLLYRFIVLLVALVWLNVVLLPSQAINFKAQPLPFQINCIYPSIASNGVGQLGALLAIWSAGRLASPMRWRISGRFSAAMIPLGIATLVAAQYRTGYIAFAVAIALFLIVRGKVLLALLAVVAALATGIWGTSSARKAEPFLLRGQSTQRAALLSSRVEFWRAAIPVWERSPVIGGGLTTASRFEVLVPLGFTTTSTIHSTWVEALVGTGVVGLGLLASAVLALWRDALRDLIRPRGLVAPGVILALLTVTSVTGTTFEEFSITFLIILVFAFQLARVDDRRARLR